MAPEPPSSRPPAPRTVPYLLLLVAVGLLLSGCLGFAGDPTPEASEAPGDGPTNRDKAEGGSPGAPADDGTSRNGTEETGPPEPTHDSTHRAGRQQAPTLPDAVVMEDADVVEKTDQHVTFAWTTTVGAGPAEPDTDDRSNATSRLHVPPGLWFRLNATLHAPEGTDAGPDGTELELTVNGDQWTYCRRFPHPMTCRHRQAPMDAWDTWDVAVDGREPDLTRLQPTEVTVVVQVRAMEGPWGDLEPQPRPSSWPSPEEAEIRPGVGLGNAEKPGGGNYCTANFVFRSPDNRSLYLGTAAHCLETLRLGSMVSLNGVPWAGRLVYCSWANFPETPSSGCPTDATVETGDDKYNNDLALLEIRPDLRDQVHPAVRHWGGPTGVAKAVEPGDRVLAYGNSSLRGGSHDAAPPDPADAQVGHVEEVQRWLANVRSAPPVVSGDSGGPALAGEGRALGTLTYLRLDCQSEVVDGVTRLGPALSFLRDRTDLEVELVTWPLLREPPVSEEPAHVDPGPEECPI